MRNAGLCDGLQVEVLPDLGELPFAYRVVRHDGPTQCRPQLASAVTQSSFKAAQNKMEKGVAVEPCSKSS